MSPYIINRKGNSSFFISNKEEEKKKHIRLNFLFEKNVFLLPQKQIEIENRVFREINRDFIFRQNRTALVPLLAEHIKSPLDQCGPQPKMSLAFLS